MTFPTKLHLYEHRSDPSVLVLAYLTDADTYQCRRYQDPSQSTWKMTKDSFLSIYKKRRSPNA